MMRLLLWVRNSKRLLSAAASQAPAPSPACVVSLELGVHRRRRQHVAAAPALEPPAEELRC